MKTHTPVREGAATVEFAVLLPFLVFLCCLATDWARCLQMTLTANACARNGALYASDPIAAANSRYTSVQEAALAECPGLSPAPTVTTSSTTDAAGNQAVIVTVTVNFKTFMNFPGIPNVSTLTRSCQMRIAPTATR
jgi:Flp pilus assembly protein TadG